MWLKMQMWYKVQILEKDGPSRKTQEIAWLTLNCLSIG